MTGYLVTASDVGFEQVLPDAVTIDAAAVGVAWQLAVEHGLKDIHVFRMDEERWFARVQLP